MAVSRESKAKTLLAKKLRDAGHYGRRHEDQFAVGILDLIIALKDDDVTYHCEAKIINGLQFKPRERQFTEALRINGLNNKGAVAILMGYKEEEKLWYIAKKFDKVVRLTDCVKQHAGEPFADLLNRWRETQ